MGNVKDPHINNVVLTGKVVSNPESRVFGESTLYKVAVEVQQTKKVKGQWERQKWTIDAKGWNKSGEKLGKLSEGALAAFTGKLEADIFEYQGQMRQKLFITVFSVDTLEAIDRPSASSPKPPEQQDIPPGEIIEEDIPF